MSDLQQGPANITLKALSCSSLCSRISFSDRRFSVLGSHETMAVLCTQYMMMEVRYPLSAGNRHIQIPYSVVEMH